MPFPRRSLAPRLRTLALSLVAVSAAAYGTDHVWNSNLTSGWFYDPGNYRIFGYGVPLYYFGGGGARVDVSGGPSIATRVEDLYIYQDTAGVAANWTFDFGSAGTRYASGFQDVKSGYIQGSRDQDLSTTWTNAHFDVAGTTSLTGGFGTVNTLTVDGGTGDLAHPSWNTGAFVSSAVQGVLNVTNGASFVAGGINRQYGANARFDVNVASGGVLSAGQLSGFTTATFSSGAQGLFSGGLFGDAKTLRIGLDGAGTVVATPTVQMMGSGNLVIGGGAALNADHVQASNTAVQVDGLGSALNGDLVLTDQTYTGFGAAALGLSNGGAVVGDVGLLAYSANVDAVIDGGSIKGAVSLFESGNGGAASLTMRNGSTVDFLRVDPFTGYGSRISGTGTLSLESGSALNVPIEMKNGSISVLGGSSLNEYTLLTRKGGGASRFLADASTVNGLFLQADDAGSSIEATLDHGASAGGSIGLFQDAGASVRLTVQGGASINLDENHTITGNGTLRVQDGGRVSARFYCAGARLEVGNGGTLTQLGRFSNHLTTDVEAGGRLEGGNFLFDGSSVVAHDGAILRGPLAATSFDPAAPTTIELGGASSDFRLASLSVGGVRTYPDFGNEAAAGNSARIIDGAVVRVDGYESPYAFDVVSVFAGSTLAVSADSRVGIGPDSDRPFSETGFAANTVTVFEDGWFYGRGTIQGVEENGSTNMVNVVNAGGHVEPGNSPGSLHVLGNYLQSGGVLDLEIGGLTPDLEYDQLDVSGDIRFTGGTIHILPYNGYVLPNDATFRFFTGFSHLTIDPSVTFVLDGGLTLQGFDPTTGSFSLGAPPAAVPEPASLAAVGVGTLAFLRRRRRA